MLNYSLVVRCAAVLAIGAGLTACVEPSGTTVSYPVAATPAQPFYSYTGLVPNAPPEISGQTIQQLSMEIAPLHSPIDGQPAPQIACKNCHVWNKVQLCDQGSLYASNPAEVARIAHPYGGAFKRAIGEWARTGCR